MSAERLGTGPALLRVRRFRDSHLGPGRHNGRARDTLEQMAGCYGMEGKRLRYVDLVAEDAVAA